MASASRRIHSSSHAGIAPPLTDPPGVASAWIRVRDDSLRFRAMHVAQFAAGAVNQPQESTGDIR